MTHQDKTVLYAEDNPENRLLVRRILEDAGYTFIEASTGEEAIELATTHRPELILMDLNFRTHMLEKCMDGYTAAAEIKHRGYDGSIIAVTSFDIPTSVLDTNPALDDYIQKPIIDELAVPPRTIDSFLDTVAHYCK